MTPPKEVAELAGVIAGDEPDPDVLAGLDKSQHGNPLGSLRNVVHVLSQDPAWQGRLRWNAFEDRDLLDSAPLTENALADIALDLDGVYKLRPSSETLFRAVRRVAQDGAFHPVRDWLDRLRWDRTPRLDDVLAHRLGAERSAMNAELARRWFIGAVARVYEPGCKMDTTLVLVGKQGVGKSSACRALVPEARWFSDTLFDLASKDAYLQIQGVWIYEIAELQSLRSGRTEAGKAFLSSAVDRYRRPYGRMVEDHPRQVVFVATTNEDEFLDDHSGSRRFWPVRVGTADIAGLTADRDQLWAEAVFRHRAREPWWLPPEWEQELRGASQAHETQEAWSDLILAWADGQDGPFTVGQVLSEALLIPAERMNKSVQTRVGRILAGAGFRKHRPGGAGRRPWVWERE